MGSISPVSGIALFMTGSNVKASLGKYAIATPAAVRRMKSRRFNSHETMFGELCACGLLGHLPFGKSKNFDLVTDAAQSVMSDGFPAFGCELDERLTGKCVAIMRFGQGLNTCGFVRGGTKDAKLDAFRHTDIPIKNFANMQPGAKRDIGFSLILSSLVDGNQSFVCLVKRGDSGFRSRLSGHAVVDWKYCKYRIADEPQNFTATSDDGAGRDLEIIVLGE